MKRPWTLHTLDKPGKLPGHPDYRFFDLHDADEKRLICHEATGTKEEIAATQAIFDLIVLAVNAYQRGMDGDNTTTYDPNR